jgi:hypothetical protein
MTCDGYRSVPYDPEPPSRFMTAKQGRNLPPRTRRSARAHVWDNSGSQLYIFGREDASRASGPASAVLRGYGRRVGTGTRSDLLSGLTPYEGCPDTGPPAGSWSFRHPPALPVRSAWPGQEAGVSQIGGQRVRAIPQHGKGRL